MILGASPEPDASYVIQVVLGPAVDGGFYLIGAIITPEGFLKVSHCNSTESRLSHLVNIQFDTRISVIRPVQDAMRCIAGYSMEHFQCFGGHHQTV